MRYRLEYADGRCCNFANSRKDLLDWLKLLKDEQIVDIRKIYKSGVTDSVLDSYRSYLKQWDKPEMKEGNPIRLYSLDEITEIFCKLGLRICNSFADFSGKPSSDNDIQLMVYSIRE